MPRQTLDVVIRIISLISMLFASGPSAIAVHAAGSARPIAQGDPPAAAFSSNPQEGTAPLAVTFSNSSSNASHYEWDFGDGASSFVTSPVHTYTTSGIYTVTLQAGDGVLTDTLIQTNHITVTTPPSAAFSANPLSGSVPLSVTFSNNSSHASGYIWDFGDGVTSEAVAPLHTYTQTGIYTVTLQAGNGTITDTLVQANAITVTTPIAAFSANPLSGSVPLSVTFSNNSSNASGYIWDFGDGATSLESSPVHTYTSSGVYTVTLQAGDGTVTDTLVQAGYITATLPSPQANFGGSPTSGETPLTVTFVNSSTNATAYIWDFGDGATSLESSPVHTYTSSGVYTVTLQAGDGTITDTLVRAGYINTNAPPMAAFSGSPVQGTIPLTVTFSNQSSNADSYLWNFGQGQSDTGVNPTTTYTRPGLYPVSLQASAGPSTDILTRSGYITATERISQIELGETWVYSRGLSAPPNDWADINFAETNWLNGPSGIGYGRADVTTVVADMQGSYASLYARHSFNLLDPAAVYGLSLELAYEDGFIAYLNGTPVLTVNLSSAAHTALADSSQVVTETVSYNLSEHLALLDIGQNVLAIQGHNDSLNDASFALIPVLQAEVIDLPLLGLSLSSDSPTEVGQATTLTATLESGSNISTTLELG